MPNTRLTVYNFIWHLIDTSTAYFIEKKCSSYQSNSNNEWTIDYITGFVKLRGNSNSLDRWLAIPQHTGEKTLNITVNHAYWSWKHYMTVYFLAYLFGNRQIYEHRRTHGSSRGSSETQNEVFITSVVFLFLVYSVYNSPSYACYINYECVS